MLDKRNNFFYSSKLSLVTLYKAWSFKSTLVSLFNVRCVSLLIVYKYRRQSQISLRSVIYLFIFVDWDLCQHCCSNFLSLKQLQFSQTHKRARALLEKVFLNERQQIVLWTIRTVSVATKYLHARKYEVNWSFSLTYFLVWEIQCKFLVTIWDNVIYILLQYNTTKSSMQGLVGLDCKFPSY